MTLKIYKDWNSYISASQYELISEAANAFIEKHASVDWKFPIYIIFNQHDPRNLGQLSVSYLPDPYIISYARLDIRVESTISMLNTLFHELQHAYQYQKRLRPDPGGVYWKNKYYNNIEIDELYYWLPWEIEARFKAAIWQLKWTHKVAKKYIANWLYK